MRACLLAAAPLILTGAMSSPSVITSYSVDISLRGDTLSRTVEFRGVQGSDRLLSRVSRGFEPSVQSVHLETAEFGRPGTELMSVPPWAVDTLTGGSQWRRALVTAFPALTEGMEVRYRVRVDDWSTGWSDYAWALLEPSVKGIRPDTSVFTFTGVLADRLSWSGRGYTAARDDGILVITASDSSGTLAVSTFRDHGELGAYLLREALAVLGSAYPPDLREAALQATSAGAGIWAQSMRARTLLCNSFSPVAVMRGEDRTSVRNLQEILDSRHATPIEMAVVYAAICRELGMEARIVPAGGRDYGVPVPDGWDRFLVRIDSPDGDHWMTEPSAFLTPAALVYSPCSLNVIRGGLRTIPPTGPEASSCGEHWHIDPIEGTFELRLDPSGWFDMTLRRKTAGTNDAELLLLIAEWTWLSGRTVVPDSLFMTDPYTLDAAMEMRIYGRMGRGGPSPLLAEYLPMLDWGRGDSLPGRLTRTWTVRGTEGAVVSPPLAVEEHDEAVFITDLPNERCSRPLLVWTAE